MLPWSVCNHDRVSVRALACASEGISIHTMGESVMFWLVHGIVALVRASVRSSKNEKVLIEIHLS